VPAQSCGVARTSADRRPLPQARVFWGGCQPGPRRQINWGAFPGVAVHRPSYQDL